MSNAGDHSPRISLLSDVPILMYHKIDTRREIGINALSPPRLRRHVELFSRLGYRAVTFRDFLSPESLPEKPMVITFDDAYESVYRNAFPMMETHGFKGVVFIIAGFINAWNDWDANLGGVRFRHMSQKQLRELDKCGWELGAHSLTHRGLTYMNQSQMTLETRRSKEIVEDISSKPVASFAYPFGLLNQSVLEAVKAAGYRFACRGVRGAGQIASDPLRLNRIPVYSFEGEKVLRQKLRRGKLAIFQKLKLTFLSWPANLTPFYQFLFKPQLWLDNPPQTAVYFHKRRYKKSTIKK